MALPNTLEQWLEYIQTRHFRDIDLGLDRVRSVWHALGSYQPPMTIAVAGTNGKGSSVAMLESVLRTAGLRTGSYTSPHLVRYNERIRVNGVPASDSQLCAAFARIDQARGDVGLTWFEFGTLAALWLFRRAAVETAVLEVGMGGRLDAVNVVHNDVALITSIGLDHGAWLGRDRARIGAEKAGIIKRDGHAVCADPDPPASIEAQARKMGAQLWQLGSDFQLQKQNGKFLWRADAERFAGRWHHIEGLSLPLSGVHQQHNAAGAIAALAVLPQKVGVTPEHVAQGLRQVSIPGRLQRIPGQPELLFDVSHNLESSQALATWLKKNPSEGRNLAVFGVLKDKPVAAMVQALAAVMDRWFLATLAGDRGQSAEALAETAEGLLPVADTGYYASPVAAFEAATEVAAEVDRIVVFGSFHTVGDIITRLKIGGI